MTDRLDIDKCYISGCQCGKPKFDDLRTRIVKAICAEVYGDVGNSDLSLATRAADAVIRELCMHREDMNEWAVLAEGFRGHRYVTHWEPNDEH